MGCHTRIYYRTHDHVYRGPLRCDVSHGSGLYGCDLLLITERLLLRLMHRSRALNGMGVQHDTTSTCETICCHRHLEQLRKHRKPVRAITLRCLRLLTAPLCNVRIGSFTWKAEWGPEYHPSMFISLAALICSSLLALGSSYVLSSSCICNINTNKHELR